MKMLPVSKEWSGINEEATQHTSDTRTDRTSARAVPSRLSIGVRNTAAASSHAHTIPQIFSFCSSVLTRRVGLAIRTRSSSRMKTSHYVYRSGWTYAPFIEWPYVISFYGSVANRRAPMSQQSDNVLIVPSRNVLLTRARWGVGNGPTPDDAKVRPAVQVLSNAADKICDALVSIVRQIASGVWLLLKRAERWPFSSVP
jgi:hypothetical protein